ncbi:MAG: pilus assembly protein PilP [Gemmatimonadales bacterium]|nr:pilus assembly protein PilP [Gemmatimonadales bacterium]
MAVRTAWFVGTLILVTLVGMLAAAPAVQADTKNDLGSVSPSQESRARINALRANEFFYQSYGKTDPFKILVAGEYEQTSASDVVDMNSAKLVGVMWGQDDRFALVEDGEGFGYILRVGDRVRNGRVVSIRKNSLTARITLYGITNKVLLKLEKTEG